MTSGKTVVVVDDEQAICEILKIVFEEEGYQVGIAHNGVDALALLRALPAPPCIVLLDLMMPVMDGNEVYRVMKADPSLAAIPVVITTSDPSRAPSGVPIMKKPIALDRILEVVRACC